jgi:hypothetical protein
LSSRTRSRSIRADCSIPHIRADVFVDKTLGPMSVTERLIDFGDRLIWRQAAMLRDRGSTGSPPRWVKVFGIIAIVAVLLFAILHLTGNSLGGHTSIDGVGGLVLSSGATERGMQQR